MLPAWLGITIAFVYGASIGSFLNVCIYRFPAEKSIVNPPSHCPRCNNRLRVPDLVPLFSFLFLGRKCRYCKTPISWRYFCVELLTALLFVAVYLRYDFSTSSANLIDFIAYALFVSALLVAFFTDLDEKIIPDQVVIAGIVIGIARDVAHIIVNGAGSVVNYIPASGGMMVPMLPSISGMVVGAGVFYLIAFVGYFVFKPKEAANEEKSEAEAGEGEAEYEGALGFGDVSLAAAIGSVLGIGAALVSFFLAVIVGSVLGVIIIALKMRSEKKGIPWRTEIPFGPYMVVGVLAVLLLNPQLSALWQAWVNLVTRS